MKPSKNRSFSSTRKPTKPKKPEPIKRKSIDAGEGTSIKDTSVMHIVRNKKKEPKIIEKYIMKHLKKFNEDLESAKNEGWKDYERYDDTIPRKNSDLNLEEAAKNYADDIVNRTKYSESKIHLIFAFKEGAKWQKKQ